MFSLDHRLPNGSISSECCQGLPCFTDFIAKLSLKTELSYLGDTFNPKPEQNAAEQTMFCNFTP